MYLAKAVGTTVYFLRFNCSDFSRSLQTAANSIHTARRLALLGAFVESVSAVYIEHHRSKDALNITVVRPRRNDHDVVIVLIGNESMRKLQ